MSGRFVALSVAVAVMCMIPAAARPADTGDDAGSVMRFEWDKYLGLPWQFDPPVPFEPGDQPENNGDLVVFGYLPYWKVGDVTLQLNLLSHLAYFGVGVNGDGSLGDTRHWGQSAMDEIMAAAHAEGVDVVLVATAFSSTVIETLLSSATNRAAAVQNLVDLVVDAGGDGVNVDFEGVPLSVKTQFVQFVSDLKDAMDAALGESSVTLAMPAVDWKGSYDYDALAEACDGLFLMEYDFHYAGGEPGPVSPLAGSDKWGKYSVTWSLDDYDTWGGVANRGKFIMGLPLYGYDWPSTLSDPPSTATSSASSVMWASCNSLGTGYGWQWDEESSSPWFEYYSGAQYRQVWCETPESLSMRMALARERGLAGVGFWALGYEGDRTEPWQAIVSLWGLDEAEPVPEIVEENTTEPSGDNAGVDVAGDAASDVSVPIPDSVMVEALSDAVAPDVEDGRPDASNLVPDLFDAAGDVVVDVPSEPPADIVPESGVSSGCTAYSSLPDNGSTIPATIAVLLFFVAVTILSRRRGRTAGVR